MPPDPLRLSGLALDLSGRLVRSGTVAASPSAATETVICTLTIPEQVVVTEGVILHGWAALTVGASGVSAQLKIRRTGTSGTTVKDSGATTATAGNLLERGILGFDANEAVNGQVYVLTLTVASGAATSTVSAAELIALII